MTQTVDIRPKPATTTVDPGRWPDVATLPPGRLRPRVARVLFERIAARLAVQVVYPNGRRGGGGGPGDPEIRLVRPGAFYARLGASGLIGFGEAYMAGDWDAPDLPGALTVFAREMATLVPPSLQRMRDWAVLRHPDRFRSTKDNSQRNISHHYDLSNELFTLFLDPTMTYSSALFPTGPDGTPGPDDLTSAQGRKIERLLDVTRVGAGTALLEIGTGWGELALRAARRGATVTTITLSAQQQELARARIAAAGMADRVDVQLCDYRDAVGDYDVVLSVEMIEAVGFDFLPEYFAGLARLTRPQGRIGLQAITMPHDRMLASRDTWTWILKYIFPGGLVPSVTSIQDNARAAGLAVEDSLAFGAHYARTLALWQQRFTAATPAVDALGFDAVFRRMWLLYLAYSEAGFRSGYLDVHQFVLTPTGHR